MEDPDAWLSLLDDKWVGSGSRSVSTFTNEFSGFQLLDLEDDLTDLLRGDLDFEPPSKTLDGQYSFSAVFINAHGCDWACTQVLFNKKSGNENDNMRMRKKYFHRWLNRSVFATIDVKGKPLKMLKNWGALPRMAPSTHLVKKDDIPAIIAAFKKSKSPMTLHAPDEMEWVRREFECSLPFPVAGEESTIKKKKRSHPKKTSDPAQEIGITKNKVMRFGTEVFTGNAAVGHQPTQNSTYLPVPTGERVIVQATRRVEGVLLDGDIALPFKNLRDSGYVAIFLPSSDELSSGKHTLNIGKDKEVVFYVMPNKHVNHWEDKEYK